MHLRTKIYRVYGICVLFAINTFISWTVASGSKPGEFVEKSIE